MLPYSWAWVSHYEYIEAPRSPETLSPEFDVEQTARFLCETAELFLRLALVHEGQRMN